MLVYYYYYYGDMEFEKKVKNILAAKDYDSFMKVFEEESKSMRPRLPRNASLCLGDVRITSIDITNKDNFTKITHSVSEWG